MRVIEPIFRDDVHAQTNGYSLTRSAQTIFNFYLARIEYSRNVGKIWSRAKFPHFFHCALQCHVISKTRGFSEIWR